jgi:hypothetical protein
MWKRKKSPWTFYKESLNAVQTELKTRKRGQHVEGAERVPAIAS